MKISTYIKNQRKKLGLSQKEMAIRLELKDPQIISNIERGIVQIPIKRIFDFAKVLNISEDFILFNIITEHLKKILKDSNTDNEKLKYLIEFTTKLPDLNSSKLQLIKDLLNNLN